MDREMIAAMRGLVTAVQGVALSLHEMSTDVHDLNRNVSHLVRRERARDVSRSPEAPESRQNEDVGPSFQGALPDVVPSFERSVSYSSPQLEEDDLSRAERYLRMREYVVKDIRKSFQELGGMNVGSWQRPDSTNSSAVPGKELQGVRKKRDQAPPPHIQHQKIARKCRKRMPS